MAEVVHERLLVLMDARGLRTPEDLARFAGVTKQTGYNWMGSGAPSANSLRKIAKAFGVTTDYLLGLAADPPAASAVARPSDAKTGRDLERAGEALAEDSGRRESDGGHG